MKIIILAAGKGERLLPLTRNTPKPLLDMGNGNTLLEEQIESIKNSGVIDEIILVIGYLAEQVEAKIKYHQTNGMVIKTVFNPFYEVSNNLMSLWMARPEMDTDFLITNGDNLFKSGVFKGLIEENGEGIFLSVNQKSDYDDDDMKVTIDPTGSVERVSKKIPGNLTNAESPGLVLIRGERNRNIFINQLDMLARDQQSISQFWLEIFNLLYERGVPVMPWFFDGKNNWQEVDFHMDVERVKELISLRLR